MILDIGCGSGLMLNSLEKLGKTTGMDMSVEAIQFSQEIMEAADKVTYITNHIKSENYYEEVILDLK
jgi:2-polyprenyl-3-methyl-5-hydroxy-6-metoxy-1,4-benzoquinol methylase